MCGRDGRFVEGHESESRRLLAVDDPHVATACVRLLSSDFDVVCVVSDGEALIERAHQLQASHEGLPLGPAPQRA